MWSGAGRSSPIAVSAAGAAASHFAFSAPTSLAAGGIFVFSVTAKDAGNNTVPGYTGTVHFSSTDPQAALPADAALVAWVDLQPAGPNAADPAGEPWSKEARLARRFGQGAKGYVYWDPQAIGPDPVMRWPKVAS